VCDGLQQDCQETRPVQLELEVISVKPKIFVIDNILSSFECDHIVSLASTSLTKSLVGSKESGQLASETRSSLNTWISRTTSEVIDSIFKRFGDLLNIDERLISREFNAEALQVFTLLRFVQLNRRSSVNVMSLCYDLGCQIFQRPEV
jgi:hypothetical protein